MTAADLERKFAQAVKHYQNGQALKARKILDRLEKAAPGAPQIIHLRGFVELDLKNYKGAVAALEAALGHFPDDLNVRNALGSAYRQSGRLDEAVAVFRDLTARAPGDVEVLINLGNALSDQGDRAASAEVYAQALALDGSRWDARRSLAEDLKAIGRTEELIAQLEILAEGQAGDAWAPVEMGRAHSNDFRLADAGRWFDEALRRDPDNRDAQAGLAKIKMFAGRVGEGMDYFAHVEGDDAHALTAVGTGLMYRNYLPDAGPIDLLTAGGEFHRRFGLADIPKFHAAGAALPERGGPIRLGILSGKFGGHPFAQFLLPVLPHLAEDRIQVEMFADRASPHPNNAALAEGAQAWHDISAMTPEQSVDFIHGRGLDILVTPTGAEETELLTYLAARAAPVQMAAFGIFGTTGFPEVDYLLADRFHVPEGAEDGFSETVLRLPDGYIAYAPPGYLPPVVERPAEPGGLMFGCFNNLAKLCDRTVALWARVLDETPGASLLIKTRALDDPEVAADLTSRFEEQGVKPERLFLEGGAGHKAMLEAYNRIDLQLDPLAYSGGLTTLESLWMGVPVVTLPGETFARRHSLSHLSNAGLSQFVAKNEDDYVRIAAAFPDIMRDAGLDRAGVRAVIKASPLSDGKAYADHLTGLLEGILRR